MRRPVARCQRASLVSRAAAADDACVRIALALFAVIGCSPGLAPSVERAHDELIASYRGIARSRVTPNVEYLGDGCYIVGDRLDVTVGYGCVVDPRSPTGRTCLPTGGVTFMRRCRQRVDLISGSDCVETHPPEVCKRRVLAHDENHGRGTCTVRMRASGGVEADLPLALTASAMLQLRRALGKRWSGVGPLVWAAEGCGFPIRVGKRYTPSSALDELIATALRGLRNRCGLTTVHVTNFETCVF